MHVCDIAKSPLFLTNVRSMRAASFIFQSMKKLVLVFLHRKSAFRDSRVKNFSMFSTKRLDLVSAHSKKKIVSPSCVRSGQARLEERYVSRRSLLYGLNSFSYCSKKYRIEVNIYENTSAYASQPTNFDHTFGICICTVR